MFLGIGSALNIGDEGQIEQKKKGKSFIGGMKNKSKEIKKEKVFHTTNERQTKVK